jgi:hypothetical protein
MPKRNACLRGGLVKAATAAREVAGKTRALLLDAAPPLAPALEAARGLGTLSSGGTHG